MFLFKVQHKSSDDTLREGIVHQDEENEEARASIESDEFKEEAQDKTGNVREYTRTKGFEGEG